MSSPDYQSLIDAETWEFIRRTESFYPPETVSFSLAQQRAVYDEMCRAFHAGHPEGVTSEDRPLGGISCRIYLPSSAPAGTVVYFHGGGFVVGGLESHDDVCAEIAASAGLRVIAVDYRLAPEHKHPAAFEDALAATRAAATAFPGPLLLAGDSAGGTLAAAVAQAAVGTDLAIAGQVLIYPGLGGDPDRGSYLTHANAPMLTRDEVLYYARTRYEGEEEPVDDITATPLWTPSFAGLPPTLALSAECDPLADDARAYASLINAEGGQAVWLNEAGLVHGYLRARHSSARARASFARVTAALAAMAAGHWPE